MSEKVLSIVIPSYNVEKYLYEIVPHYINSDSFGDIELIIVNDGSKDKTLEIAKEYANAYPESIKYVDKQNGGHGSTINVGKNVATGKYFKIIDGDDWVDEKEFDKFIKILKTCEDDVVLSPYVSCYPNRKEKQCFDKVEILYQGFFYALILGLKSRN